MVLVLVLPNPRSPVPPVSPVGLPPPSPVGAAHHIRIQSSAPIPARLISALWSTASTASFTNMAHQPHTA